MHRYFIGPAEEAKIDTEFHTGTIKRGQRIRVTQKEAGAMDKLPDTWAIALPEPPVPAERAFGADRVAVKVKVKKRSSRSRRRKK